MIEYISDYLNEVGLFKPANPRELEDFRIKYLGKKGILQDIFNEFRDLPGPEN